MTEYERAVRLGPNLTEEQRLLRLTAGHVDADIQATWSDGLPKPDMVNAPPHYTRLSPEPIEVIERWGLDFFTGSALKYLARAGFKGDAVTDLRKAVSFLNRRIQQLEKGQTK